MKTSRPFFASLTLLFLVGAAVCWWIFGASTHPGSQEGIPVATNGGVKVSPAGSVERIGLVTRLKVVVLGPKDLSDQVQFQLGVFGPEGSEYNHLGVLQVGRDFTTSLTVPGKYFIHASAPGWICDNSWIVVDLSKSQQKVILRARKGRALHGIVVNQDEVPVVGAELHTVEGGRAFHTGATTGPDGRFEVTVPLVEQATLDGFMALAKGYLPEVQKIEERDFENLKITLRNGRTVTGQVVDSERGAPISGAKLKWSLTSALPMMALWSPWAEDFWQTETDEQGRFEMPGVFFQRMSVQVSAVGYASNDQLLEPNRQDTFIELSLERGFMLQGKVVNSGTVGVPGAQLKIISREDDDASLIARLVCNAAGEFSFPNLARGSYELAVLADSYAPILQKVDIPSTKMAVIVMQSAPQLTGALQAAAVQVTSYQIELRDAGGKGVVKERFKGDSFVLNECPVGGFEVWFHPQGGQAKKIAYAELVPGELTDLGQVSILSHGATITGRVQGKEDLRFVDDCLVSAYWVDSGLNNKESTFSTRSGVDGGFQFIGLPDGRFSLLVEPSSEIYGGIVLEPAFQIENGSSQDIGAVFLPGAGTVSVTVIDRGGVYLLDPEISIARTNRFDVIATIPTGKKEFLAGGLAPGFIQVSYHENGIGYSAEGKIRAGETTHLEIDLRNHPMASWRFLLLDAQENPLSKCLVHVSAEDGSWSAMFTHSDANGYAEQSGPLLGDAILHVRDLENEVALPLKKIHFSQPGRGPQIVRFDGGSIYGIGPEGAKMITLVDLDWGVGADAERVIERIESSPGERFSFRHLSTGTYAIRFKHSATGAEEEIVLPALGPGESLDLEGTR